MDKKTFERIVSGALAASMTFTLVPASAFAASSLQTPVPPPPQTVFLDAENSGESVTGLTTITDLLLDANGIPTGQPGDGLTYDASRKELTIESGYKLESTDTIGCSVNVSSGAEI